MPKINLSDLQSAANTKFSDFEVTLPGGAVIAFSPVLRLPKAKRVALGSALDVSNLAADTDVYDLYREAFRIVARDESTFPEFEKAVGDDPAVWQELFEAYSEETQAGEAKA